MATTSTTPTSLNTLSTHKFRFAISDLPATNFFVQSVNIPSLSFGRSDVPTPFSRMPLAGDHMDFGELQVSFNVDEAFQNYLELHDWMRALAFPESWEEYKTLNPTGQERFTTSDATLLILSNSHNPIIEVHFESIFPTFMSDLNFDSRVGSNQPIDCTVTFAYQQFKIRKLNSL